jgi:hypothetical protein
MNAVLGHSLIPYFGYDVPMISESSNHALTNNEYLSYHFDHAHFSNGYWVKRATWDDQENAKLYNKDSKVELVNKQIVGTLVDLYA